jgi:hypothetical protein
MQNHHGGVILLDSCLYGANGGNGGGDLVCLNFKTGSVLWDGRELAGRPTSKGSITLADGGLGPELLVADHCFHDGIEAAAGRAMTSGVAQRPLDQFRVPKTAANHANAPMFVEDEVGRGREDVFLREDDSPRDAQPTLDFGAFLRRNGLIGLRSRLG